MYKGSNCDWKPQLSEILTEPLNPRVQRLETTKRSFLIFDRACFWKNVFKKITRAEHFPVCGVPSVYNYYKNLFSIYTYNILISDDIQIIFPVLQIVRIVSRFKHSSAAYTTLPWIFPIKINLIKTFLWFYPVHQLTLRQIGSVVHELWSNIKRKNFIL